VAPLIKRLSHGQIEKTFWAIFLVTLLVAIFPPCYLAASGVRATLFGLPGAIAFWIIDPLVLLLAMSAYFWIEHVRGDLDADIDGDVTGPVLDSGAADAALLGAA